MTNIPPIKLVIRGQTPSKKSKPQIILNKKTGKRMLIPNKKYQEWIGGAKDQLRSQFPFTIDYEIRVITLVYRHTRRRADLINGQQSIHDALQEAGIIEDDFLIKSTDGSRLYLGFPAEEARAEITILPFSE